MDRKAQKNPGNEPGQDGKNQIVINSLASSGVFDKLQRERIPETSEALDILTANSEMFLSSAFRHSEDIQKAGVTSDMIASGLSDLGTVMLTAPSNALPEAISKAGLGLKLASLPDPGPMPLNALGEEIRRAYAGYKMALAIECRDVSAIAEALRFKEQAIRSAKGIRSCNIEELLLMDIPTRQYILSPIIPVQGLAQLFAPRGIGKTFLAQFIAVTVASGGQCLRWNAPKPRKVAYIDGEMPAGTMQERFASLVAGIDVTPPDPSYLNLITPDLQDMPMPDLSTKAGQQMIEPKIKNADLIILDNLSTLCRTGRENEAESWLCIQDWLLSLRQRQKSVLIIHHAGKSGQQRGTSRREDILDTVISLQRPKDYKTEEGARFEVHLTKGRGIFGEDAQPFEAQITTGEGGCLKWITRSITDVEIEMVRKLLGEGYTVRDIAEETGLSRSKVGRLKKNIDAEK
jgi:hypothetical protein